MREFCIENQGTNTYLVYTFSEDDVVDTMSLGMLTNNHIQGVTETSFYQMDAVKQVKYNITSKVEIQQMFERTLNRKQVLGIFSGIVNALLEAEEYMLEPSSIVLDKKYIFADVSTYETTVICVPVIDSQAQTVNIGMFFKELVFTAQFDPTENCDYVTKIINFLNSNPTFSLMKFKQLLDGLKFPEKSQAAIKAKAETNALIKKTHSENTSANRMQSQMSAPPNMGGNRTAYEKATAQKMPVQTNVSQPMPKMPVQGNMSKPMPNMQVQQKPEQKSVGGMQIPGNPSAKMTTDPVKPANEKQMSRLYLLQHYSKENAAIYKAQQEQKKNAKGGKTKKESKKAEQPVSYVVPGAEKLQATHQTTMQSSGNVQKTIGQQFVHPPMQNQMHPNMHQGMQPQPKPPYPAATPNMNIVQKPVQRPSANFGDTTVLISSSTGETSVLSGADAQRPQPHLFRIRNNERIVLNKPVFRIGKERSYVDYFVSDNAAVSRSHANIVEHAGNYYVVDTNSTNHTYVNGKMIQSNSEVLLSHGDRLRLANEEFEFRMM